MFVWVAELSCATSEIPPCQQSDTKPLVCVLCGSIWRTADIFSSIKNGKMAQQCVRRITKLKQGVESFAHQASSMA